MHVLPGHEEVRRISDDEETMYQSQLPRSMYAVLVLCQCQCQH